MLITRRDWMVESTTTMNGGNWLTPFSSLIDPRPQTVIQAASVDPESTMFTVDFGAQRNNIGIIGFQRLMVTSLATMRVRVGTDASFTTNQYDSGIVSAWPQDKTPFSIDVWGNISLNGTYDPDEYVALGLPRYFVPTTPVVGRYVKVEIFDTTAAVPCQIGCFGVYETWEPEQVDFGWSITWIDESDVQTVPYGSRFIIPRGKRRKLSIGLSSIKTTDLMSKVQGWAGIIGKSRPVVMSIFPDDKPNLEKRTIYGTLTDDIAISNPYFARYQVPLTLEQLI